VRTGLTEEPWQYSWSSAVAHLAGCDDRLVRVKPLLEMFGEWREYLTRDIPEKEVQTLQRHERTGRPLGDETFLANLKEALGRTLRSLKSEPKGPRRKELNR